MLSDSIPADAVNILALIVGVALLLREVAKGDDHHRVRVLVLTIVISIPVVLFFLGCISMMMGPRLDCLPLESNGTYF